MKVAAVKLLTADDVLERNTADSIAEQTFERPGFILAKQPVIVRVQILPFDRQAVRQQDFSSQSRIRDMIQLEPLGRRMQGFADVHAAGSLGGVLRRSAWKCAVSGSIISLISPFMM